MSDVAVVGVGDWGRNLLRVFDEAADVQRCCHAGAPDTREWLTDAYPGVGVTTDYDEVLASDVEAVVVATPIDTHVDLVERALRAGKHVFVEKPLGPDRSGAAAVADVARERDLVVFVGYLFVHHPLFERVGALAREGLGSVRLSWNYVGEFATHLVTDYVCHPVSVTTALFGGRPDAVAVTGVEDVTDGPGPDALSARLTYGDVDCSLRVSRLSPRDSSTRVAVATDAGDYYLWDDTVLRRLGEDGRFREVATADAEPLAAECRAFLRAVASGTTPRTDGAFAVTVHDVLAEIAAAARTF